MISFGLVLVGLALHGVVVDGFVGVQAVADTTLNHLPLMFSAMPWVRWPPSARLMPMMVSPGFRKARNTASLAEAPQCGCTLAASAPKICLTRSIASCSAMSTYSQPP